MEKALNLKIIFTHLSQFVSMNYFINRGFNGSKKLLLTLTQVKFHHVNLRY